MKGLEEEARELATALCQCGCDHEQSCEKCGFRMQDEFDDEPGDGLRRGIGEN